MKKLNIFFCFLLLGSIILGLAFYPIFILRQEVAKTEMRNFIRSGSAAKALVQFSFTESEYSKIKWLEKGKELRVNDDLLDVISITKNNDGSYKLIAVSDSKEKQLYEEADDYSKSTSKTPVKLLLDLFSTATPPDNGLSVGCCDANEAIFPELISFFNSNTTELSTPPPEQV